MTYSPPNAEAYPQPAMGSRADGALTWCYARAHFGKSLFWNSGELIFAYFLTEVAGLSGWQMATVMGLGMATNAVIDILIGRHLGQGNVTLAAAGRTQLLGAAASAAALLMLFTTSFVSVPFRSVYALVAMLAFRIAYAFYDVPQNAMLSLGTVDGAGRAKVSSLRQFFSAAASVAVAAASAAILTFLSADERRMGFIAYAILFAIVALTTACVLERRTRMYRAFPARLAETIHLSQGREQTLPLPTLMLMMFLISIGTATFMKLEPYYVAAIAEAGFGPGMLMIATSLGIALSQPFWLNHSRKGGTIASRLPSILLLVSLALFGLLAPLGVYAQLGGAFLFGLAHGGVGQALWTAYADSVSARAGDKAMLAFGLFTGIAKLGLALSAVIVGGTIAWGDSAEGGRTALLVAMVPMPMLFIAGAFTVLMLTQSRSDRQAA